MPTITSIFEPREYQLPLLKAIDNGYKRIFAMWHRRAGKDFTLWNAIVGRALEVKGLHYYFLPTYTQAKKVIWDGVTNHGDKFIDCIPKEIVKSRNATELKIELINGSIIQLIGTDKYDAIRGTNPITCVFSEYAYQNPMAWEVVKPILQINGGVAIFNTTPNGKNHAFDLWKMAVKSDEWFTEQLSIRDTGVVTDEEVQQEIDEGMDKEFAEQEYYCSFEAGVRGNYYSQQLRKIKEEERIKTHVYDRALKVHTAWDIGYSDATAIVFYQLLQDEIRIIDYYEDSGLTLKDYIQVLNEKGYVYGEDVLPHDAKHKRMDSGQSIAAQMEAVGRKVKIAPSLTVNHGIMLVKEVMNRCYFEEEKTDQLLHVLGSYKREYDPIRKVYSKNPNHDWSSHGSDAFRYMCVAYKESSEDKTSDIKDAMQAYMDA